MCTAEWECTQQQLRCYAPKRKRRHCDETTITGCTEVIILTTSSAASDENLRNCRFCAWAIWKHGHVDHLMPMLAVEVVIATTWATVSDQRVATAPRSPNHRFFALNCCYKYSNRFHHSRNCINQSSNIWYGEILVCMLMCKNGYISAVWLIIPHNVVLSTVSNLLLTPLCK